MSCTENKLENMQPNVLPLRSHAQLRIATESTWALSSAMAGIFDCAGVGPELMLYTEDEAPPFNAWPPLTYLPEVQR